MIVDIKGKLFNPPKQWWDNPITKHLFAEEIMQTYKEGLILAKWYKINQLRKSCGAEPCPIFTSRSGQ